MQHTILVWSKRISIYLLITVALSANATQIRELPVHHLHDVSIATYDQFGPVIYYNPRALQELGPQISVFVRAHEYAHHILQHIHRGKASEHRSDVSAMRRFFELEADCFAAKKVSRNIAMAAANKFARTHGVKRSDNYHPTGKERANIIKKCAGISLQVSPNTSF